MKDRHADLQRIALVLALSGWLGVSLWADLQRRTRAVCLFSAPEIVSWEHCSTPNTLEDAVIGINRLVYDY